MWDRLKAALWSDRTRLEKVLGWLFFASVLVFFQYQERREAPGFANVNAYYLLSEGKLDQAIAQFDEVIKAKPDWYHPYIGRGTAYTQKGELARALADLNRSIGLRSDQAEAYYRRGRALRLSGETARAMEDFARAAKLDPKLGEAYFERAVILRDRNEFTGAVTELDAAILARPDKADYRVEIGRILLVRLDQPARAADAFAAGVRDAFSYRSARALLDNSPALKGQDPAPKSEPMMDYGHAFMPDAYYLLLWTHVARVRAGQDDAKEVTDHVRGLAEPLYREMLLRSFGEIDASKINKAPQAAQEKSLEPWPGSLIALFLGTATAESIRAQGEASDSAERARRACDVSFYLAIHAMKQQPAAASALLQTSVEKCPAERLEGQMARMAWK